MSGHLLQKHFPGFTICSEPTVLALEAENASEPGFLPGVHANFAAKLTPTLRRNLGEPDGLYESDYDRRCRRQHWSWSWHARSWWLRSARWCSTSVASRYYASNSSRNGGHLTPSNPRFLIRPGRSSLLCLRQK